MPDIFVRWYDDYGNSHNSPVYFVDSTRDRFLVVDGDRNFRRAYWVAFGLYCLMRSDKKENKND